MRLVPSAPAHRGAGAGARTVGEIPFPTEPTSLRRRQDAAERPRKMTSDDRASKLLAKLRKHSSNRECPNCGTVSRLGHGHVCMKFGTFICPMCKTSHQAYSHLVKVSAAAAAARSGPGCGTHAVAFPDAPRADPRLTGASLRCWP